MLAVHTVRVREMGIGETAADLMRFERRARKWPERFDVGGLDGPPGSSQNRPRPPRMPREIMARIIELSV